MFETQKPDKRDEVPTYFAPLLLGFVAIVALGAAYFCYGDMQRDERRRTADYHNKVSFSQCVSAPDASKISCFKKAAEAPYQHSQEYYDLKAQQDMAKWALLMFVITTVGVVYIAMTLRASSETLHQASLATGAALAGNVTAEKVAVSTNKAVMTVETIVCTPIAKEITGNASLKPISFECTPQWMNSGQTVAKDVRIATDIIFRDKGADQEIEWDISSAEIPTFNIGAGTSRPAIVAPISVQDLNRALSGDVELLMLLFCEYTDDFSGVLPSGKTHTEVASVRLEPTPKFDSGFDPEVLKGNANKVFIRFVPTGLDIKVTR